MRISPLALPSTMGRVVERAIVWTVVVATIAWSIGLSFLINVPFARAAVSVPEGLAQSSETNLASHVAASGSITVFKGALAASSSEVVTAVAFNIASVAGPFVKADIANCAVVFDTNAPSEDGISVAGADAAYIFTTCAVGVNTLTLANASSRQNVPGGMENGGMENGFPLPASMTGRGNFEYALVVNLAAGAVTGHSFNVSLAVGTSTFVLNTGTYSATAVTSRTLTIGVPALLGGGPMNGQNYTPPDALIDINADSTLDSTTVNTTNVTLYPCTGATDATSCTTPNTTTNLCSTVTLSAVGADSNRKITCGNSALAVSTTYRFRVASAVAEVGGGPTLGANTDRIFRTTSIFGGSGGSNTTPPAITQSFPASGATGVAPSAKLTLQFPTGAEGTMKTGAETTGSVENHSNFILQVVDSSTRLPGGTDLCGATCTLTWDATNKRLLIDPTDMTSGSTYEFAASGLQNTANQGLIPATFIVRFSVGAADGSAPTLRTGGPTNPANAATNVSPYIAEVAASFSEPIASNAVTLSTVRLCQDSTAGTAGCESGDTRLTDTAKFSIRYDSLDFTVRLGILASDSLAASTKYCIEIVGGASGVMDVGGNAFTPTSSANCFTTGTATDPVSGGPKLVYADADNFKLVARFSEAVKDGSGTNGAENPSNYTLECPVGVTVNLTGKTITYRTDTKEVEIQGLGMATDQSCRLTAAVALQDLAGNAFDTSGTPANNVANFKIQSSSTTGGLLGSSGATDFDSTTNFATFWEKPQRCQPRTNATNKATSLECEFPAPAALPIGSSFTLTFPSEFTMSTGDGNTRLVPAAQSSMNGDVNGGGTGTVTLTASTDTGAKTVVLTTAGAAIANGESVRFELDRLTTPTTPVTDARISIIVKDESGVKTGATIQAAPFTISQAGSLTISGKVCKGSSSIGTCGGSDTNIANVKVFCDQIGGFLVGSTATASMGHQEATTNAQGVFSISGLTAGQYGCNIPPDMTNLADTGGSANYRQVIITSAADRDCGEGSRSDCVDFKFTNLATTGKTLTVTVSGLNDADSDADDFDVFCSSGFSSFESSAPVMKAVDAATAGNTTTTLKLQGGKTYECGMGPHIAFEQFGTGAPPPPPTFTFMPPKSQKVTVPTDTDPTAITFALQSTNRTITGTVVDGSANGIANAYVNARPVGCFDVTTGEQKDCFGSFAQTVTGGTFTLNVADGTYEVSAGSPGLPPSTNEIVTVNGANVTSVTLKIVKSSTTISGQILDESGNGIKYAHVNGEKRTITTGTDACDFSNSRPAGGFADSPTDESGNYTLYAAAGTWCVRSFAPSYGEVGTKTVTITGTTSQTGQNIQASSGNFGTVSGSVTKAGSAVSGAFVNCFSPGTGGNGAQSSADGAYSLKVKLPSSGTASYSCDSFAPGIGSFGRQTTTLGGATTTATVNFTLTTEPGTITVTIANITDAFCDARDATGFGAPSAGASAAGVYTINVPPGTYTVRCGGPKYGRIVEQASVAVTAGATVAVTGTAPTTRTVTGRVTDGSSNVAGATTTFTDTSGKSFTVTTGAQTGTTANLSVSGVPEGTYTINATKKGYEFGTATATVGSSNLTLSSPIALTLMAAANGDDVKFRIKDSDGTTNYAGEARVMASKGDARVVGEMDATTSIATVELTNGTWSVKAVGDNGYESASSSIVVTSGDFVGAENGSYDKTLSLTSVISGYTQKSEIGTMSLSGGGLAKFGDLAVGGKTPEINVPSSTLSRSDSSTGKIEMRSNPMLKDISPGSNRGFVGSYGYDITPKDGNGNEITSLDGGGCVTITIPYTDADVAAAGVEETELKFGSYSSSAQAWETFGTTVDRTNKTITACVTHFSSFGIIGTTSGGAPTTSDTTPPAAVGSPQTTATASAVTLTWTDPEDTDFDSVEVLRSNPPSTAVSGTPLSRVTKGTKKYVDSSVAAGTSYTYLLRSRDTTGNTRNSGSIAVTTPAAPAAGAPAAAPTTGVVTPAPTTTAPAVTTPAVSAPATPGLAAIGLSTGDVIKASSSSAAYLVGADGKRYVYPNEVAYKSWNADFSGTKTLTASQLSQLPLGGVVTVRPGTWLVKIESDPKVYAVEPGGTLRWVETEARALQLFGADWNKQIIDVPVSYWPTYRAGAPLGADQHPTGSLVKSGTATYYIDAGKKRLVSTETFAALGFQSRFVRALSSALAYEDGPALTSASNLKFASE